MASLSRWMKILAIGSVLAGVFIFVSSIFVLNRIPICAPPPPPGDAVLGCFVHDLASVLAPLSMMIAIIGGLLLLAESGLFEPRMRCRV